jgi:type I restriction enzyme M protein
VWIVSPRKARGGAGGLAGQTLFVDARARGRVVDRVHAELAADDVAAIAGAYRSWRAADGAFVPIPGFAKAATLDEIRGHRHALVPGRYVGFAREPEASAASFSLEIAELRERLAAMHAASDRFLAAIEAMSHG